MDAVADIVIVNWNSGRYLRECVDSIRKFGGAALGDVVVVDNGSSDDSLNVDGGTLRLDVMRAGENLGFARACNLGASRCTAPYILFLNPDAMLMAGALDLCVAYLEDRSAADVGICGARLVDETGNTQRHCARFPVWRTYVGTALGLNGILPALFPSKFMDDFDHRSSRRVDHVIGAFFLVRRRLFEDLHGFDERFFVYMEDVDFSLRAAQAGWTTWYLAEATAFHHGGGTSQNIKARRLFFSLRSRMLYAMKHFARYQAAAVIVLSLCVEPFLRVARALLRGSMGEMRDTLRGYAMLWKAAPGLIRSGPDRRRPRTLSA